MKHYHNSFAQGMLVLPGTLCAEQYLTDPMVIASLDVYCSRAHSFLYTWKLTPVTCMIRRVVLDEHSNSFRLGDRIGMRCEEMYVCSNTKLILFIALHYITVCMTTILDAEWNAGKRCGMSLDNLEVWTMVGGIDKYGNILGQISESRGDPLQLLVEESTFSAIDDTITTKELESSFSAYPMHDGIAVDRWLSSGGIGKNRAGAVRLALAYRGRSSMTTHEIFPKKCGSDVTQPNDDM